MSTKIPLHSNHLEVLTSIIDPFLQSLQTRTVDLLPKDWFLITRFKNSEVSISSSRLET